MSTTEDKKLTGWLTFERAISLASILIAVGGMLVTVSSLDRRVTKLEDRDEQRQQSMNATNAELARTFGEIRGDIRLLLERTDPTLPRGGLTR